MKTLINKANPAIRITAPEIEVHEEEQMYIIPAGDYCIPMCIPDWTLVEEEPEVDLEKEIDRLWDDFSDEISGPHNKFDIYARVARHFYELGLKARREE